MRSFYNPHDFKYLRPVINNVNTIVDEITANVDLTLFQNVKTEHVVSKKHHQLVERLINNASKRSDKINPKKNKWTGFPIHFKSCRRATEGLNTSCHFEDSRELSVSVTNTNIKTAPKIFPKTYNILKSVDKIYYSGLSFLGKGSSIKPHIHTFNNPTLTFHLCLTTHTSGCTLNVNNEHIEWKEPGQMAMFDSFFNHSVVNNSSTDRCILHLEVDADDHPDYIWPYTSRTTVQSKI